MRLDELKPSRKAMRKTTLPNSIKVKQILPIIIYIYRMSFGGKHLDIACQAFIVSNIWKIGSHKIKAVYTFKRQETHIQYAKALILKAKLYGT